MSARSFRSVFMVASCAGAALGCYLVSLRVASERAALEDVETKIVLAQRDIRLLQTEIGTRGRLAQLERWNVKVIALSAPTADQFLKGGFELARLTTPEREAPIDAPVILASAPASTQAPASNQPTGGASATPSRSPTQLIHHASLKTAPARKDQVSLEPRQPASAPTLPRTSKPASKAVATEKGKASAGTAQPKTAAAEPQTSTKAQSAARDSKTKSPSKVAPKKSAARDPLAPMPEARTKLAAANVKPARDPARKQ